MKRATIVSASFAAMTLMLAMGVTTPVAAQDATNTATVEEGPDDKYNMVIVYGDDECPPSIEGEMIVCARQSESDRFRIPKSLRTSDSPENVAWAERVEQLELVGASGVHSCSPTGAGGLTGCTQQLIDNAFAEKREHSDVRFGQLIEEARAERLSTIDVDAAMEQERVETIEREYLERLERERAAPLPGDEDGVEEALPSPVGDE